MDIQTKETDVPPFKLTRKITEEVNIAWNNGSFYDKVSPVTQDLLRYWFHPAFCDDRKINFHEGQRQSILNIIYLHEVLGVKDVKDLYYSIDETILQGMDLNDLNQDKYQHPMYAVKMATGTGKTWVMHALLIWQYLNADAYDTMDKFSKNFLIIAPGLIVYNRLLDAFLGKENNEGVRDFDTSDFKKFEKLFIPNEYRDKVFSFIQTSVAKKEEISNKITGDGLIAITNWHLLSTPEENTHVDNPLDNPHQVFKNALPISPGKTGIDLSTLDNNFIKGTELEYLSELENLVVFNDEAHHLHRLKRDKEKKWQQSLNKISENKGRNYIQIDFSATPYKSKGGKNKVRHYFPHIIVDFDLTNAIHKGLVKMIAIDKRDEVASIKDLDFRAERDDNNKVIGLSDGQRLMLRAGYTKLMMLEDTFSEKRDDKYPKMLVICEDTNVAPFVTEFFINEGLNEDDVLEIHSNKQGEVSEKEWERIKHKLFNIDKFSAPKIIVSVLMLREGFDVNNICVIVPLRSTQSDILLEQTIGRGLRLMWREPEYQEIKAESRYNLLVKHREPTDYLDLLSIVEHPNFIKWYDEMDEIVEDTGTITDVNPLGDMITVGLRENYEEYDFFWPIIIQESEEIINNDKLSLDNLEPYEIPLSELQKIKGEGGEKFKSQEITLRTTFGEYRVSSDIFNINNYNEFLSNIISNVTSMFQKIGRNNKSFPMMQINQAELTRVIDHYIRNKLFNEPFNPMENENWRILLMSENSIIKHIIKQISKAIQEIQSDVDVTEAIIERYPFSSVDELRMREDYSIKVTKCIYERLPYPSRGGGLEEAFIKKVDSDGEVEAFTKINEYYHTFATITYIREDGLLARYYPDFIVKIRDSIYIVETKADKDLNSPNVQRKRIATLDMLDKINQLSPDDRMNSEWKYVLLGEKTFYKHSKNEASIKDILEYSIINEDKAKGYSTLDSFK